MSLSFTICHSVPTCRQLDRCMFGPRCWYRHDSEIIDNEEMNEPATNSELIKKLIDMMEIFSNKIVNKNTFRDF